jgi:hypothetical protein
VSDPVWQPRADVPVEPLETLIRTARQFIPLAQQEQSGGSFTKTLTLDLADWGNPSEVTMHCAVGRRSTFAGRTALEYLFDGSLASAKHYRSFRGQAVLDVESGAVLNIEFATNAR